MDAKRQNARDRVLHQRRRRFGTLEILAEHPKKNNYTDYCIYITTMSQRLVELSYSWSLSVNERCDRISCDKIVRDCRNYHRILARITRVMNESGRVCCVLVKPRDEHRSSALSTEGKQLSPRPINSPKTSRHVLTIFTATISKFNEAEPYVNVIQIYKIKSVYRS